MDGFEFWGMNTGKKNIFIPMRVGLEVLDDNTADERAADSSLPGL